MRNFHLFLVFFSDNINAAYKDGCLLAVMPMATQRICSIFGCECVNFCAKKNAKQREKRKFDSDYIKLSRISQKNRGKSIDLGAGSW